MFGRTAKLQRCVPMGKVVYTDVDLTLLDFNEPFEEFIRSQGHDIPYGATEGQAHLPACFDVSQEVADELVRTFFLDATFGALPPIAGAQDVVQRLHKDGWKFVAITACPDSVHELRRQNLKDVFGFDMEVHYSGFGGCKKDILTKYAPTVWVEDNVGHAEVGLELGYETFLINQRHNRDATTGATRVDTWLEIEERLCSEPSR